MTAAATIARILADPRFRDAVATMTLIDACYRATGLHPRPAKGMTVQLGAVDDGFLWVR